MNCLEKERREPIKIEIGDLPLLYNLFKEALDPDELDEKAIFAITVQACPQSRSCVPKDSLCLVPGGDQGILAKVVKFNNGGKADEPLILCNIGKISKLLEYAPSRHMSGAYLDISLWRVGRAGTEIVDKIVEKRQTLRDILIELKQSQPILAPGQTIESASGTVV